MSPITDFDRARVTAPPSYKSLALMSVSTINVDTVTTESGSAFAAPISVAAETVYFGASNGGNANNNNNIKWLIDTCSHKLSNRFVGRCDILDKMRLVFNSNLSKGQCTPVVLKGLAGMGKTQLMLQYMSICWNKYEYIFLLDVDSVEAIKNSFGKLAAKLNLNRTGNEKLETRVQEWLQSKNGWLLLLDNMDKMEDVIPFIPGIGGDIIVTTRNHVSTSWATIIPVDKMTNDDALRLLLGPNYQTEDSSQLADARDFVHELDCFPLAIDILRANIDRTGNSFRQLKMLKRILLFDKCDYDNPHKYKHTVEEVWKSTIDKIRERDPLATRILDASAFLQSDSIPESLFLRRHETLLFPEPAANPVCEVISAIGVLSEFSIIQRQNRTETFAINRLVQFIIRDAIKSPEHTLWYERLITALAEEVVSKEYHDLQVRKTNEGNIPHVRHIVAQMKDPGQMSNESQNLFVCLLGRIVLYLINSATFQGIEELSEKALSISIARNGSEDLLTAVAYGNQGRLYVRQGKYNKAEQRFLQALKIRETVLGLKHPDTAVTLKNLADLYVRQGLYDKAETLYDRALSIFKEASEQDQSHTASSLDTASLLNNLGVLYVHQGKYADAELRFKEALKIRKTMGSEHPSLAATQNDLATLRKKQSEYNKSEKRYKKALDIWRKVLGPEHPHAAQALNNLGNLYVEQKRYDDAEQFYNEAQKIREKVLGLEHPDLAETVEDLADLYKKQKKYDKAIACYRQAHDIWKKLGSNPEKRVANSNNIASIHVLQVRYDLAKKQYKASLKTCEALGSEHPYTVMALGKLASLQITPTPSTINQRSTPISEPADTIKPTKNRFPTGFTLQNSVCGPNPVASQRRLGSLGKTTGSSVRRSVPITLGANTRGAQQGTRPAPLSQHNQTRVSRNPEKQGQDRINGIIQTTPSCQ